MAHPVYLFHIILLAFPILAHMTPECRFQFICILSQLECDMQWRKSCQNTTENILILCLPHGKQPFEK